MKPTIPYIVASTLIALLFSGCATILKGYYDEVTIHNAPEGMRIFTQDSVEIPMKPVSIGVLVTSPSEHYESRPAHSIMLRSNEDHILTLKQNGREKRVHLYPEMEAGWFILDAVLILPMIFDLYTGNLNGFKDIDGSF